MPEALERRDGQIPGRFEIRNGAPEGAPSVSEGGLEPPSPCED